jgi:predicted transcriptional regulator
MEYEELTHLEKLLLECEKQPITSEDAQITMGNASMPHASGKLVEGWKKGLFKRKRISKKKGGMKYRYFLTEKGLLVVARIHARGF